MNLILEMISWNLIDVLEVSGGTYSHPGENTDCNEQSSH